MGGFSPAIPQPSLGIVGWDDHAQTTPPRRGAHRCAPPSPPLRRRTSRSASADQDAAMFDNSNFQSLEDQARPLPRAVRLVQAQPARTPRSIGFMNRAEPAKADVLVHFTARRGCYNERPLLEEEGLPRPEREDLQVRGQALRARRTRGSRRYGAWNEANHVSQPTFTKPKLAAKYFLALRSVCRSLLDRRRRRARLQGDAELAGQVQAQREEQGADLRPAQLRGREPQDARRARA